MQQPTWYPLLLSAMNSLLFKLNMLLLHRTFEPHKHVNSKCKRRSQSPKALNPPGGEGSSPPRCRQTPLPSLQANFASRSYKAFTPVVTLCLSPLLQPGGVNTGGGGTQTPQHKTGRGSGTGDQQGVAAYPKQANNIRLGTTGLAPKTQQRNPNRKNATATLFQYAGVTEFGLFIHL